VLQQDRALKILAAVQPGTQNKMTVEQRAGFAKKGDQVFAHGERGHSARPVRYVAGQLR
jgi:hypothetical protein